MGQSTSSELPGMFCLPSLKSRGYLLQTGNWDGRRSLAISTIRVDLNFVRDTADRRSTALGDLRLFILSCHRAAAALVVGWAQT